MTPEEPFLRAIADAAGDDVWQSRLIYADWLEEQGDERAELVRAYVASQRDRKIVHFEDTCRSLLRRYGSNYPLLLRWMSDVCLVFYVFTAMWLVGEEFQRRPHA